MNCQEFDHIINELARSRIVDASLRESALAHSTTCQLCAARLANARSLAEGLAALAATTESKTAPSCIEDALLAAFRQQPIAAAPAKAFNVLPFSPRQKRAPLWALAAAAVLIVAFGIFAASQLRKAPATPTTKDFAAVPSPSPTIEQRLENQPRPETTVAVSGQQRQSPTFRKNIKPPKQTDDGFSVSSSLGEFSPLIESPNARQEIATDFLPLTFDAPEQAMESGQVIRVQLPRTALASF